MAIGFAGFLLIQWFSRDISYQQKVGYFVGIFHCAKKVPTLEREMALNDTFVKRVKPSGGAPGF